MEIFINKKEVIYMLNSIFSSSASILEVLISSLCSLLFGFLIALTHKWTSKNHKEFLITVTILPFLIESIILMASGNVGISVAILGAFSLVKFRSLPGTSKEILSVFFAMTVGLACGMGSILFAFVITLLGCLTIFVLSKTDFFFKENGEKILKITVPENLNYDTIFNEEFDKYTKKVTLEKVKTTNMGSLFDLSYRVVLKEHVLEKAFIDDLRVKNGNLKIILSQSLDETDL